MHVLIMLLSSCLSRYAQVNIYRDCYNICYISTDYYFQKGFKCSAFLSLCSMGFRKLNHNGAKKCYSDIDDLHYYYKNC